jgi:hypothetical protein
LLGAVVAEVAAVEAEAVPAIATVAHLKLERRDMPLDGVPHGAVNFGESLMIYVLRLADLIAWVVAN